MAVILAMTYQKKLGLPQYSSHSCSLSVQVEVSDLSIVEQESTKLYGLLQSAVDLEIQKVGFMPDVAYGIGDSQNGHSQPHNGNGHRANGSNGHHTNGSNGNGGGWKCSDKQKELIEKIVSEHKLDKNDVEQQALEMFNLGVKQLNRLQASGLIEELLEKHGGKGHGRQQFRGRTRARTE